MSPTRPRHVPDTSPTRPRHVPDASPQVVTKLHQILRPFLLRRLKQDVELELPKKHEFILFAWMSEWQSTMYEQIIKKNLEDSGGQTIRLNNVLMQLRKCCNHPYLFEWPLGEDGNEIVDDLMMEASGKLQVKRTRRLEPASKLPGTFAD